MVWLWIWGIVAAVNLMIEFWISKLLTIWFSAGGMVTLLVVALIPEMAILWQFIIFAGVSIALLIGARKLCVKLLNNDKDESVQQTGNHTDKL